MHEDMRQEDIQFLLGNLKDHDPVVKHTTLNMIVNLLRTSSTPSSLPATLLTLISNKGQLLEDYKSLDGKNKQIMADILSVVSATGDDGDTLRYRVEGGSTPLDIWGHQYVKKLASDLINAYSDSEEASGVSLSLYHHTLNEVLPCLFKFNAECDAIDLLLEIDSLERLVEYVDQENYERMSVYLNSSLYYVENKEKIHNVLYNVHKKMENRSAQLYVLIKQRRTEEIVKLIEEEKGAVKMQLAYIAAKRGIYYEASDERVREILKNTHVKDFCAYIAKELELTGAKEPSSFLRGDNGNASEIATKAIPSTVLSSSFVNATFREMGLPADLAHKPLRGHKVLSVACTGLLNLWDPFKTMEAVEEDVFGQDGYVTAGSVLAMAISGSRVIDSNESSLGLIREFINAPSVTQRIAYILSLVSLYTGSQREDIFNLLLPLANDREADVSFFALFGMGSVYAESCDVNVASTISQVILERIESLGQPSARFASLGLSLIFLRGEDKYLSVLSLILSIPTIGQATSILVRGLAYACTGNTAILHGILKDALEGEEGEGEGETENEGGEGKEGEEGEEEGEEEGAEEGTQNGLKHIFAILSAAAISMGDETATQMGTRVIEAAMLIDSPEIQIALPMGLALLYSSNPKVEVTDTLKRCAHSGDISVVVSSIAALGIVSAGTNNSRVASSLEQMHSFYAKSNSTISILRLSQGLLHLGKGTLMLSPIISGSLCPKSFTGLIGFALCFMEKNFRVLEKYFFLSLLLAQSIKTKYLISVNDNNQIVKRSVRVGTPVDVSGVAGRPKRITGAQTHDTPVLLQMGEAAEFMNDPSEVFTTTIKDIVIVRGSGK